MTSLHHMISLIYFIIISILDLAHFAVSTYKTRINLFPFNLVESKHLQDNSIRNPHFFRQSPQIYLKFIDDIYFIFFPSQTLQILTKQNNVPTLFIIKKIEKKKEETQSSSFLNPKFAMLRAISFNLVFAPSRFVHLLLFQ